MNEDLFKAIAETAAEAARVAALVPQDALGGPTPCTEFDLRTLVNHWILWGSHALEHRALRQELPEALTEVDFTATPSWRADFAAALDRAVAAWSRPEVWEGDITSGAGATPAPQIAALLFADLALHTWDVARSVGADLDLSDPAAALLHTGVAEVAEMYRQYDGFAAQVPLPETASPLHKALAASGRDPGWTA
ncbi:TIGR03086 family metal-binding protein [Actinocorallia herbida]|nr:TIGR03086 family metal-binding protein [Actinocorallia herbida]